MIERLRQTYRHLLVHANAEVEGALGQPERALVAAMSRPERRHALRTYARLRAVGADAELCLAGLLHDVGKPAGTRLWHRVAAVLAPGVARRVGGPVMRAYLDHARIGAERLRELSHGERVARLVARHHEPPLDGDEAMLARADRE